MDKKMKKIIGYIGSYFCYYIGDFFSKLAYSNIFHCQFTFDMYQKFMNYSIKIQEWANNQKPWKNKKE
jgi:hypothetical protein